MEAVEIVLDGLKKSLHNITFLAVWCHVNERMKPNDNINGQKWPHLSSYWARVPAAWQAENNNHFSVIILSFASATASHAHKQSV